jgi:prepilin-type N-terminal cleavage/methylation domain-containing protein
MHRAAFSIIELIVVISIIAVAMGMAGSAFAKNDNRRQAVRVSADELAATLRQARALAISRRAEYGVVFHIQNEPSSTGRILNNRTGGHWYRIVGPSEKGNSGDVDALPRIHSESGGPKNMRNLEIAYDAAKQGETHFLPAGKVRFLALSDMDWGDSKRASNWRCRAPSSHESYPRPWFGYYNQTQKKLYPWGGFDSSITGSGFYYQGVANANSTTVDAALSSCTNTATRILDEWSSSQNSRTNVPAQPSSAQLYATGEPRPLINADWRDCSIIYNMQGHARWGGWMPARHCDGYGDTASAGVSRIAAKRGVSERCNGTFEYYTGAINQYYEAEVVNHDLATGGWYFTLAPDAPDDNDSFPSARAALESMMPIYRVFASQYGDVRVIPVSQREDTGGLSIFPPDAAWWSSLTNLRTMFPVGVYFDGSRVHASGPTSTGAIVGRPITDWVTPGTLSNRQVWLK